MKMRIECPRAGVRGSIRQRSHALAAPSRPCFFDTDGMTNILLNRGSMLRRFPSPFAALSPLIEGFAMADKSVRGRVVWHELVTPDEDASHAFYADALGWKAQGYEHDASYRMFAAPTGPLGATVPDAATPPH